MRTRSIVEIRLSVQAPSRWDEDVSMRQVKKQAIEEVIQVINRELGGIAGIRVIGKPKVTVVLACEDELIVDSECQQEVVFDEKNILKAVMKMAEPSLAPENFENLKVALGALARNRRIDF